MKRYHLNGDIEVQKDFGKLEVINHTEVIEAPEGASREDLIDISLTEFTEEQEPVWCQGYPVITVLEDETVLLPHTLIKDLEDIQRHIASDVRSLSRGKLLEQGTLLCLDGLSLQVELLTKTIEKARQSLRGDSSWQRW